MRDTCDADQLTCLAMTQAIIDGCPIAFESYYNSHFELMFNAAKRLASSDDNLAYDIVHDSMLKAARKMRPIADPARLKAWTTAVVSSVAYDYLRSESARKKRERIASHRDEYSTKESVDEIEARLLWIEQRLRSLPIALKHLIDLRYRLGWSLKRIGEHLGLKTGAVDGKIRRAIEQLAVEAKEIDD